MSLTVISAGLKPQSGGTERRSYYFLDIYNVYYYIIMVGK